MTVEAAPLKFDIDAYKGYVTGLCHVGGHEGKQNFSQRGDLLKPCLGEYNFPKVEKTIVCKCWCHEMWRQARNQLALSSLPVPGTPTMTDSTASVAMEPPRYHVTTPVLPFVVPGIAPPTMQNIYERFYDDPSLNPHMANLLEKNCKVSYRAVNRIGRGAERHRNTISVNIEVICHMIVDGIIPRISYVTPDLLSILSDPEWPTSRGAITNALRRLQEEGFVKLAEDPFRFDSFIGDALTTPVSVLMRQRRKK